MIDDTVITRLQLDDPSHLWSDTDEEDIRESTWKALSLGKDEFLLSITMSFTSHRYGTGDILFLHKIVTEKENCAPLQTNKNTLLKKNNPGRKTLRLNTQHSKYNVQLADKHIQDVKDKLSHHKERLSGELIIMMKKSSSNFYFSMIDDLIENITVSAWNCSDDLF